MNLLADESVDRQIVERLQQDGHHVLYIAETEPKYRLEAAAFRRPHFPPEGGTPNVKWKE